MNTEQDLFEECARKLGRLPGASKGFDKSIFQSSWAALQAWLHSQCISFRGGSIQTFAKIIWQHAKQLDGTPVVLPVFVLNDSFAKAHMLQPGVGLTKASALSGTELQPCEEVNFSKLALRFSTDLNKDTVFTCIRHLVHAIGEALQTKQQVCINFGIGELRSKERRVEFTFSHAYAGPRKPHPALLRPLPASRAMSAAAGAPSEAGSLGNAAAGRRRQQDAAACGGGSCGSSTVEAAGTMHGDQQQGWQHQGHEEDEGHGVDDPLEPSVQGQPAWHSPAKASEHMEPPLQQEEMRPEFESDEGSASPRQRQLPQATPPAEMPSTGIHQAALQPGQQQRQQPASKQESHQEIEPHPTASPAKQQPLLSFAASSPATPHQSQPQSSPCRTAAATAASSSATAPSRTSTAWQEAEQRSREERARAAAREAAENEEVEARRRALNATAEAKLAENMKKQRELKDFLKAQIAEKAQRLQQEAQQARSYVPPPTLSEDASKVEQDKRQRAREWQQQVKAQAEEQAAARAASKAMEVKQAQEEVQSTALGVAVAVQREREHHKMMQQATREELEHQMMETQRVHKIGHWLDESRHAPSAARPATAASSIYNRPYSSRPATATSVGSSASHAGFKGHAVLRAASAGRSRAGTPCSITSSCAGDSVLQAYRAIPAAAVAAAGDRGPALGRSASAGRGAQIWRNTAADARSPTTAYMTSTAPKFKVAAAPAAAPGVLQSSWWADHYPQAALGRQGGGAAGFQKSATGSSALALGAGSRPSSASPSFKSMLKVAVGGEGLRGSPWRGSPLGLAAAPRSPR